MLIQEYYTVRPPFQQNLIDEDDEPNIPEESIHCLDEDMAGIFLTKEEHDESNHDVNTGEEPYLQLDKAPSCVNRG